MGKCRSAHGATMCPSYRATREERYSTRGRARLLAEMLRGEVIKEGWQSEDVKDALHNCLACKGCRSDCPTHTDMASYKAEFFSHYYETKPLPRQARWLGRIGEWAPMAASLAPLSNALTRWPGFSQVSRWVAGVSMDRTLPRFAYRSFRERFERLNFERRNPARVGGARRGDPMILFPDTFTNYFRPDTAFSALRVLEAAGCRVDLPRVPLCCGRPYYDFGMLDRAKQSLLKILTALAPEIESGTPIVVLEPGCLSVFHDEMAKLLPDHPGARRLAKLAVSLGDALQARNYQPAPIGGKALVHGHCHQKALGNMRSDLALLQAAGITVEAPDTGCCGMAGSFGMRPETYETSVKIANQVLLPKVNQSAAETLIVANGFSCREQIEGLTERQSNHLADVLARSLV
jgi:Fe-S oxidoreductase